MVTRSVDPDDYDRVAKLLVDAGAVDSFEAALETLRTYRFQVVAGADACYSPAWQAALLTIVNAGVRAMHGGVGVILAANPECAFAVVGGGTLGEALARLGATVGDVVEPGVPTIVLGEADTGADAVRAVAGRWIAGVTPGAAPALGGASALAAVTAGGLAVSECFQRLRGNPVALDRAVGISLWSPGTSWDEDGAEGPPITQLPADVWLLGLGHLGQAYAWLLSLLPYPARPRPRAVLEDDDVLTKANRATSMLHRTQALGARKARLVAQAMEDAGWETAIVERRYLAGSLHRPGDPGILLAGVDNPGTRRLLDDTGFPVIVDAGLGAGPDGYLGITVRRLPGVRASRELWPAAAPPPRTAATAAIAAYPALERATGDRCGVEQLAGRTVATAFVGVVAAGWVIGGMLRELHGGARLELVDHSLREPATVTAVAARDARPPRVATLAAALPG